MSMTPSLEDRITLSCDELMRKIQTGACYPRPDLWLEEVPAFFEDLILLERHPRYQELAQACEAHNLVLFTTPSLEALQAGGNIPYLMQVAADAETPPGIYRAEAE